MSTALVSRRPVSRRPARTGAAPSSRSRGKLGPTIVLLIGAFYCLIPIVWVITASAKSRSELVSTCSFSPVSGFLNDLQSLSSYSGGIYWQWALNSLIYAGGGALVSTLVSAGAGYGLAKYRFRGRNFVFTVILAGVMLPQITWRSRSTC